MATKPKSSSKKSSTAKPKTSSKKSSTTKPAKSNEDLQGGGVVIIRGGGGLAEELIVRSRLRDVGDDGEGGESFGNWTRDGNDSYKKTGVEIKEINIRIANNGRLRLSVRYER